MGIVKVRDSISAALSSLRQQATRTLARERRDSQSEVAKWSTALARHNAPRQEGQPLTQLRVVGVVPVRQGQRHVRRAQRPQCASSTNALQRCRAASRAWQQDGRMQQRQRARKEPAAEGRRAGKK
jgi:hypothetical protein